MSDYAELAATVKRLAETYAGGIDHTRTLTYRLADAIEALQMEKYEAYQRGIVEGMRRAREATPSPPSSGQSRHVPDDT